MIYKNVFNFSLRLKVSV